MSHNGFESRNKIVNKLFKLTKDIYCDDDKNVSLFNLCKNYENDWNVGINVGILPDISERNICDDFDLLKSKLNNNDKKFVVLGKTSSGKSTLINAFLTENLLPTEFGSTSNCFIEIKGSLESNRNYLVVNNEEKDIDELGVINCSQEMMGSLITMYYDRAKCPLLGDDVIIIDSPGIDFDNLSVNFIDQYFRDSDVIILVVSSVTGITISEINLFKRLQSKLTKFNVAIVYNFWDVICSSHKDVLIKPRYIQEAKKILCDILRLPDNEIESKIFFISANERMAIFTNEVTAISAPKWDERNNEFASLFSYLQTKMSESADCKKFADLNNTYLETLANFNKCRCLIDEMKDKRIELAAKLKNELKKLEDFNSKINSEISAIFNDSYTDLLIKGKELLKKNPQLLNKNNSNEEKYSLLEHETIQDQTVYGEGLRLSENEFEELLHQIIENSILKLTKRIIELSQSADDMDSFMLNKIFDIYFSQYLNLSEQLSHFDVGSLENNLIEINRKIKIASGVTIGLTAAVTAAGIATGGAAFAIIGLAEAAIVGAGAAGGGAVAGGVLGSGAAFGAVKAVKLPFHFAWKENDLAIKNMWNSFESVLTDSYNRFRDNMTSNITEIITTIEAKAMKIRNNLNSIAEDLNNFPNRP